LIEFFGVSKIYEGEIRALSDITFRIKKGEFVILTGPSGAGKTTLLKLIFCAERPTKGSIIIGGKNIARMGQRQIPLLRRRIGVVFQDFKLLYNRSVYDNVALTLQILGLGGREIKRRVRHALRIVGLEDKSNITPLRLSGGEQQRVAIARAIVHEPMILLADEPTGNLDPDLTMDIMKYFKIINRRGTTMMIATHDPVLVDRFGERVLFLEKGVLIADTRPADTDMTTGRL